MSVKFENGSVLLSHEEALKVLKEYRTHKDIAGDRLTYDQEQAARDVLLILAPTVTKHALIGSRTDIELLNETLAMDAESRAFDPALRKKISKARMRSALI